ncbi:Transmembrane protein [Trichinella pseudospiralis]
MRGDSLGIATLVIVSARSLYFLAKNHRSWPLAQQLLKVTQVFLKVSLKTKTRLFSSNIIKVKPNAT